MLDNFVCFTVPGWNNIKNLIFVLDDAPTHIAFYVFVWLDQHLPTFYTINGYVQIL